MLNSPAIRWLSCEKTASTLLWCALLFSTRLAAAVLLYLVMGGTEIADDTSFHLQYVSNPLGLLMGDLTTPFPHSPPGLPLFLYLFNAPLLGLGVPAFLSLRIASIMWETIAFVVFCLYVRPSSWNDPQRFASRALWLLCPMSLMSTSIMAQDEPIALFFATIVIAYVLRERWIAAAVCVGIGVVCAKIFFLVVAGAVVLGPSDRSIVALLKRGAAAAVPIIAVYAWSLSMWKAPGFRQFYAEFTLVNSVSLWALLYDFNEATQAAARHTSQFLSLGFGLLPIGFVSIQRTRLDSNGVVVLSSAMLSWVFVFYYQVQPEYLLMLLPCLLTCWTSKAAFYSVEGVLSLPWAVNIAYAIWHWQGSEGSAKARIADMVAQFSPISPALLHSLMLVLNTVALLSMAIALTATLARRTDRKHMQVSIAGNEISRMRKRETQRT